MKVTYAALLVLSLAIIIYPCTTAFAKASEEQGKGAADGAVPRLKHDPSELLLERADRILSRLSQTVPEKVTIINVDIALDIAWLPYYMTAKLVAKR